MKKISCQILFDKEQGTLIRTLEPIPFELDGKQYTVPAGFLSDGMSVPRLFWRLISPPINAATLVPSIKHDWLYKEHICPRIVADVLYAVELEASGFPRWKCVLVYIGVSIGGGRHWRQQ